MTKNIHLNTDTIGYHIFINLLVNHTRIISPNTNNSFLMFGLNRTSILSTIYFNLVILSIIITITLTIFSL